MLIAGTRIPVWLAIVYILSLIAILAWPFTAFLSIFAFDTLVAAWTSVAYLYVGVALGYPVLPLAGVLCSFLAYKRDRKKLAYVLAGLAVVPFALMALGVVAQSIMSLVIVLGGKF
jgi:hypothetical protein